MINIKKLGILAITSLFVLAFLFGCAESDVLYRSNNTIKETLLWSSNSDGRPSWTINEPDKKEQNLLFIGLSKKYATEKEGRDAALRNATNNVVKYLGTLAKDKFEDTSITFGLSSSIVDTTASSRKYQKQLSQSLVKRVRPVQWYIEQWQTNTGIGWKVFVMAKIPLVSINESFKHTAKENKLIAQRQARAAADKVAKKQAENAVQFWSKMSEEGVLDK